MSTNLFMNKRGQWNYGLGASLIIGGIYLLTQGPVELVIVGIILVGVGVGLFAKKDGPQRNKKKQT